MEEPGIAMSTNHILRFEGFTLDPQNEELRRGSQLFALPPKTFAVLRYLAENPARLVTQAELLRSVWGEVAVAGGLLRGYVRDLRRALGDDAAKPRFIQTVPRRGFRFLPEVTSESPGTVPEAIQAIAPSSPAGLVGRDQDLIALHRSLRTALAARRQVVFIAGEAGIGKTSLLNALLDQVRATDSVRIVCGQCVEQYGTREPYLPIFSALRQLCQGTDSKEVLAILARHAPSWLAQMPGAVSEDEYRTLQMRAQGTSQSRMVGELCQALEFLSADQPLIIGLEDLQWSDYSTLDLLSILARRLEPGRLFVIGSYRPADVIISNHPLRTVVLDLQVHGQCTELLLDHFTEEDVARYLANRFPDRDFPDRLSQLIHQKTGGNPLFVTAFVDDLVANQSIEEHRGRWRLSGDPEQIDGWRLVSLRQIIEVQLARLLPDEQQILEAAAIAGKEFTADLVAAALETDAAEVEDHCDQLVRRRQILRLAQDRPASNFTGSTRYAFSHDVYRTAAVDRSLRGRRRHWYQRIAEKMVSNYGERADEVATELAYYFQQANRPHEAAHYLAVAGERASRRFAHAEAISQFQRGIELLQQTAPSKERDALELQLQVGLALPLTATQGYTGEAVALVLSRAVDLNRKLGDGVQTFTATRGLCLLLMGRGDYQGTLDLCDDLDRIAQRDGDLGFVTDAIRLRGISAFFLGRLQESRDALERSLPTYRGLKRSSRVFSIVADPEVTAASLLALVLWVLGYPDQALRLSRHAVAVAKKLAAPHSIVIAHRFRAMLTRFLRDTDTTLEEADSAIAVCDKYEFAPWRQRASLERGWAITMRGNAAAGIREIENALAHQFLDAGGSIATFVDACVHARKTRQGLRAVGEALEFVRDHKEGAWEPELHRLKGELLLQRAEGKKNSISDVEAAEGCFSTAIERAHQNSAKSFELRAAMSLSRLWRKHGKRNEARHVVSDVYDWFTEGFSTADLTDAKRLLGTR